VWPFPTVGKTAKGRKKRSSSSNWCTDDIYKPLIYQ
jgi:hypothetical protein